MIRVLNIISDTNIGGAGRVLLNYLRYTDRKIHSGHVHVSLRWHSVYMLLAVPGGAC